MRAVLTRVYIFEKPTIGGNKWNNRFEKKVFQDGTFYINQNSIYYDKDQNIIKLKDYNGVNEIDFNNYLEENSDFLIDEYSF